MLKTILIDIKCHLKLMNLFQYFKSLSGSKTGNSVKSFTLLLSAMMGSLLVLGVLFVIIYDVTYDGMVNTNLNELTFFLIGIGCYVGGSGVPKIFGEKFQTNLLVKQNDKDDETE